MSCLYVNVFLQELIPFVKFRFSWELNEMENENNFHCNSTFLNSVTHESIFFVIN